VACHHGITSGPFADWWASWVLNLEARRPENAPPAQPGLLPPEVEALRPRFTDLAGELTDSFAGTGRCEFMADFAEPYAARVIAIHARYRRTAVAYDRGRVGDGGLAMGVRIREHLPRIEAALAALYDYADRGDRARRTTRATTW